MLETADREQTRILIVDDERSVCNSVEKVLNRQGYRTNTALSVSKALEILHANDDFDLIITDLMMPQVNGMELLKIAKGSSPNVPILVITGYASIASAVQATQLGAADYLAKPFTPEELHSAVVRALTPKPTDLVDTDPIQKENVIDVDMPFDAREVEMATSEAYVQHLTRSDMPLAQTAASQASAGSPARHAVRQGMNAASDVRESAAGLSGHEADSGLIDVDLPFSYAEVAAATSEAYANALGRSDLPVVGHWAEEAPAADAPTVLVIDDEVIVVNSVRRILARRGYRVEAAFTGREGLQRVHHGNLSLVLLDMRLPDWDGLRLLSDIKRTQPKLPVLVITGYASIETAVEAVRRGATDYMAKPFTPEELHQLTSRTLSRSIC
jgi:DNA-binding NtrC family response regulator